MLRRCYNINGNVEVKKLKTRKEMYILYDNILVLAHTISITSILITFNVGHSTLSKRSVLSQLKQYRMLVLDK